MAFKFYIIPQDDPKQALRLRRFFMTLAIYVLNLSLSYLGYRAGLMELHAFLFYWVFLLGISTTLYFVIRSGLNLRTSDPSLTSIQICAASLFVMYGIYFVYEVRATLLTMYVLVLLFGIFRLHTRQFLVVSAFMLATYGIDIFLLHTLRTQDISLKIELIQWFGLAIVLISVSFIGGNISSLRRDLSSSRRKLQTSLTLIREMAIHDDLTGFYNRRHLMELIELENNRANRKGTVFSLLMMDIDHFKNINDTYGHLAGDQVLRTFSAVVRSLLRKTDFCGRYGGEEFLIVLTQTDFQAAKIFAERIRESVEKSFFPDLGPDSKVTVSIGLTEYRLQEDVEKTISRADDAMYKAKNGGRNRIDFSV